MSLRQGAKGLVDDLVNTGDATHISTAYTALRSDRLIIADMSSAAYALTLPPVAESEGQELVIEAPVGNTNTLTVQDAGDCINAVSDTTAHDSAGSVSLWKSTGRQWLLIGAAA